MRVIKKSEVRKIIIGHVELTLIFLFDYLLCKIAILESLKVLFLDKKQKLLSVDGSRNTIEKEFSFNSLERPPGAQLVCEKNQKSVKDLNLLDFTQI